MTNLSDEQLSSLLDGELDEIQQKEAIEVLGNDDKAREQWYRYHLARDAMHGNLPDGINLQFSARVMAAIDAEPAILAPSPHSISSTSSNTSTETSAPPASVTSIDQTSTSSSSSISKRFAGLAVAASVAAVAVMGVETFYRADPSASGSQQVAAVNAPQTEFVRLAKQPLAQSATATLASVNAPAVQATTVSAHPGVYAPRQDGSRRIDPRLHKYLINHSQLAARSNVQGVMPYARIVTYAGMRQQSVQR